MDNKTSKHNVHRNSTCHGTHRFRARASRGNSKNTSTLRILPYHICTQTHSLYMDNKSSIHTCIHIYTYIHICVYTAVHIYIYTTRPAIACLYLATKYRSLLRKMTYRTMTYRDMGSYQSSPPCIHICTHIYLHNSSSDCLSFSAANLQGNSLCFFVSLWETVEKSGRGGKGVSTGKSTGKPSFPPFLSSPLSTREKARDRARACERKGKKEGKIACMCARN